MRSDNIWGVSFNIQSSRDAIYSGLPFTFIPDIKKGNISIVC